MVLILTISAVALVVAVVALLLATQDFRNSSTFRPATAVAIYAAWATHAAAVAAAVWRDPFRVDEGKVVGLALGGAMVATGVSMFVLGLSRFRSFAQVTGTDPGRLVTSGIYAWTRHPQYAGWIIIFVGMSVAARSPAALLLTAAMAVAVRMWLPHEERHLVAEFGEEYRRYAARVPRFLGLSRGRQTAG